MSAPARLGRLARAADRGRTALAAVAAVAVVAALAPSVRAQPAPARATAGPAGGGDGGGDAGGAAPGRGGLRLEVDDCPRRDPRATPDALQKQGDELYSRGETLYEQGDYPGAVREFISAYCVSQALAGGAGGYYRILKDIGQAHERALDYEKAIGYFERFVREYPAGTDPADRAFMESRILVLSKLRAQILVESEPKGASITIGNASGVAGRGRTGKPIEVPGGRYSMVVELDGYEPYTREIEVRIGKPFAYFVPLRPLRGRLSVQVLPGDARVFLRDRSVERFAGIGRVDEVLAAGAYVLIAEAPGRLRAEQAIEVLPDRVNRMQLELPLRPQFGRRQLVAFATAGGAIAAGGLLYAFDDSSIVALGVLGGAAAGLFGSALYLPEQVPLGTSNLAITAGLAGTIAGTTGALLFTGEQRVVQPVQGLATALGAGLGYYAGGRAKISPGSAALVNSSLVWGTTAGGLFALAFDADDRRIAAGLVLSGLGLGGVSGVLMTQYFDVSRRRAILIDVGALIGLLGGLATESLVYPVIDEDEAEGARTESAANFALGGLAVGLIGAGILTRNLDAPKLPVAPAVGAAATADGRTTPTYGLAGAW